MTAATAPSAHLLVNLGGPSAVGTCDQHCAVPVTAPDRGRWRVRGRADQTQQALPASPHPEAFAEPRASPTGQRHRDMLQRLPQRQSPATVAGEQSHDLLRERPHRALVGGAQPPPRPELDLYPAPARRQVGQGSRVQAVHPAGDRTARAALRVGGCGPDSDPHLAYCVLDRLDDDTREMWQQQLKTGDRRDQTPHQHEPSRPPMVITESVAGGQIWEPSGRTRRPPFAGRAAAP
jgi:hypothetical protein